VAGTGPELGTYSFDIGWAREGGSGKGGDGDEDDVIGEDTASLYKGVNDSGVGQTDNHTHFR
jgi:hypothetical protein